VTTTYPYQTEVIKYSQGCRVITSRSTKHTDVPEQTPHSFRGSSTICNFKPWITWRQCRTNVTTSRFRHVIICWGKVHWRGSQQHNSYQISTRTVSQHAEEGDTQKHKQTHKRSPVSQRPSLCPYKRKVDW
jgi:hypothetical protein